MKGFLQTISSGHVVFQLGFAAGCRLQANLPGSGSIGPAEAMALAQLPSISSSLLHQTHPPTAVAQLQRALDQWEKTPAEQQIALAKGLLTAQG